MLRLLGLEDAISIGTVDALRDERGWRFTLDPDGRDPVLDALMADVYRDVNNGVTAAASRPAKRHISMRITRSSRGWTSWRSASATAGT